jgi:hypothetical protein
MKTNQSFAVPGARRKLPSDQRTEDSCKEVISIIGQQAKSVVFILWRMVLVGSDFADCTIKRLH